MDDETDDETVHVCELVADTLAAVVAETEIEAEGEMVDEVDTVSEALTLAVVEGDTVPLPDTDSVTVEDDEIDDVGVMLSPVVGLIEDDTDAEGVGDADDVNEADADIVGDDEAETDEVCVDVEATLTLVDFDEVTVTVAVAVELPLLLADKEVLTLGLTVLDCDWLSPVVTLGVAEIVAVTVTTTDEETVTD